MDFTKLFILTIIFISFIGLVTGIVPNPGHSWDDLEGGTLSDVLTRSSDASSLLGGTFFGLGGVSIEGDLTLKGGDIKNENGTLRITAEAGYIDLRPNSSLGVIIRQTGDAGDWANIEVNETYLGLAKNSYGSALRIYDGGKVTAAGNLQVNGKLIFNASPFYTRFAEKSFGTAWGAKGSGNMLVNCDTGDLRISCSGGISTIRYDIFNGNIACTDYLGSAPEGTNGCKANAYEGCTVGGTTVYVYAYCMDITP